MKCRSHMFVEARTSQVMKRCGDVISSLLSSFFQIRSVPRSWKGLTDRMAPGVATGTSARRQWGPRCGDGGIYAFYTAVSAHYAHDTRAAAKPSQIYFWPSPDRLLSLWGVKARYFSILLINTKILFESELKRRDWRWRQPELTVHPQSHWCMCSESGRRLALPLSWTGSGHTRCGSLWPSAHAPGTPATSRHRTSPSPGPSTPQSRVSQRLSCLELCGSGTFVRALRCPCGRGELFCWVSQGGSGVSCLGMFMTEAASGAAVCGQTCPLSPEQVDGSTAAGGLALRTESLLATF